MRIGGLDVGTTGCKLTVYDVKADFCADFYKEYDVSRIYGKHEVDAEMIFNAVLKVLKQAATRFPDFEAVGITTFGETFAVLDDNDKILLPSMLYTDTRGAEETEFLLKNIGEEKIISIAGVKPNQMYSLPKIMWIKNNMPNVYKKAKRILLMQDYIVYKLTGVAQIDYSLAARTMSFDIKNKIWSDEILATAGVDKNLLSRPVPTGSLAGTILQKIAQKLGLSQNMKVISGAHDQVASAVGAGVLEVGKTVDGTGTVECLIPVFDHIPENGGLYNEGYSVVPYVLVDTYVCYALSFTGGATLKWLRDNFAIHEKELAEQKCENVYANLDTKIPDAPTELLILPHFAGAATPYMDSGSKAAILGLTLEHTLYDIYKALMEGVTFEIMTNIEHLESFGINTTEFYATGGGALSDVWLQIKADILNKPVTALASKGAGACGTCMMTAVAIGEYKNLKAAAKKFVTAKKTVYPNSERTEIYRRAFERYKKLYSAVRPLMN